MNIFCVGLSHHTAPVQTRELYAAPFSLDAALREPVGCAEALLLNTCNRVELYGASASDIPTKTIARFLAAESHAGEDEFFYRYEERACVQHLFRVAAGLDSMVVGETEIFGQAKKAYAVARERGTAGPYLHRLFQRAFRVAKQVRSRTEITRGAVSIGSVAVDLAQKIFGELNGRKVLIVGAGENAERTARALVSRGVSDLRLTNRSDERASLLADFVGARAIPFHAWVEQCREIDILISSTASNEPLLTREKIHPILSERVDRPLFIIDIAVPRDIAPDVNEIEGVYLYDIDSLQSVAEQSLALRRQQIAAGEAIIADHVADLCATLFGENRIAEVSRAPATISESLRVSES
jgi:glutamyl-tRNA reductase